MATPVLVAFRSLLFIIINYHLYPYILLHACVCFYYATMCNISHGQIFWSQRIRSIYRVTCHFCLFWFSGVTYVRQFFYLLVIDNTVFYSVTIHGMFGISVKINAWIHFVQNSGLLKVLEKSLNCKIVFEIWNRMSTYELHFDTIAISEGWGFVWKRFGRKSRLVSFTISVNALYSLAFSLTIKCVYFMLIFFSIFWDHW